VTDFNNLGPLRDALREGADRFATIADAMPQLVWVARPDGRVEYYNRRWIAFTGLTADDTNAAYGSVKGAVHPEDLPTLWERWTRALAAGEPYEAEYRLREVSTGRYRWFIARAAPVLDEQNTVVRWIGTCTDIDEQHRARTSLAFLAAASDALSEELDVTRTSQRLCDLIVEKVADIAIVALADDAGQLRVAATAHSDAQRRELVAQLRSDRVLRPDAERQEWQRLRNGATRFIASFDRDAGFQQLWPYVAASISSLQPNALLVVPLQSRGTTHGGLYVFYGDATRTCDEREVALFEEVARRAAIAFDNARSLARERRIAETFQRAALPMSLPQLPGMHFDAVFQPGSDEAEIGGDWYDALALPDGSFLVSIGDVMGRGLSAASTMARVRQIINVAAMYEKDPSRILDAADHLVRQGFPDLVVTAFCGIIDWQRREVRYANAGHRAPLLRSGGACVELRSTGLPLGVRHVGPTETRTAPLDGAELLVLYTDGLVESRRPLADGEARLQAALLSDAVMHARSPAALLRDACVREERTDDVAILAIRFTEREGWSFASDNAQAANDARGDFVRYLKARVDDPAAVAAAELVFGELVGNVVRHARGAIDVQLDWNEEATLHVIDRGHAFSPGAALPDDPLSEGGRGLFIAQQLSTSLRVEHIAGYGNHIACGLRLQTS
jgi:PAS domain S-box-containing protein